jgi:thiamine-phosphate pyrophosphorylase
VEDRAPSVLRSRRFSTSEKFPDKQAWEVQSLFLYYITDRKQLSVDAAESVRLLQARIRMAAEAGVDAIQLREKDLNARDMVELGREAARLVFDANSADLSKPRTRFLINSRADVAVASGADGVHLRSDDISASEARRILVQAGIPQPLIAVSCHCVEDVELAEGHGANFAVLGPVFGKSVPYSAGPFGIAELERACKYRRGANPKMPVLALGSVNEANAAECLQAGADGIAGIRIFQDGDIHGTVSRLRKLDGAHPN